MLRRVGSAAEDAPEACLTAGALQLDTSSRQVSLAGRPVYLTVKEFELLNHLMRHPRRAFRREELLEAVWGFRYGDTSAVTVHISRLREKLETDPGSPRFIKTVRGVGYRFEP